MGSPCQTTVSSVINAPALTRRLVCVMTSQIPSASITSSDEYEQAYRRWSPALNTVLARGATIPEIARALNDYYERSLPPCRSQSARCVVQYATVEQSARRWFTAESCCRSAVTQFHSQSANIDATTANCERAVYTDSNTQWRMATSSKDLHPASSPHRTRLLSDNVVSADYYRVRLR